MSRPILVATWYRRLYKQLEALPSDELWHIVRDHEQPPKSFYGRIGRCLGDFFGDDAAINYAASKRILETRMSPVEREISDIVRDF